MEGARWGGSDFGRLRVCVCVFGERRLEPCAGSALPPGGGWERRAAVGKGELLLGKASFDLEERLGAAGWSWSGWTRARADSPSSRRQAGASIRRTAPYQPLVTDPTVSCDARTEVTLFESIVVSDTVRGGTRLRVDRSFDGASTFPSGGCGLSPWRTDLAHAVELLPITEPCSSHQPR